MIARDVVENLVEDVVDLVCDVTDGLPDGLLGSTTYNMHFTLDDEGQWDKEKKYTTVGTKVSIEGYVDYPEGPTWTIIAKSSTGWKKEKNGVATGDVIDLNVPTEFGSTKFTLKVQSERGAQDAGVDGKFVVSA